MPEEPRKRDSLVVMELSGSGSPAQLSSLGSVLTVKIREMNDHQTWPLPAKK